MRSFPPVSAAHTWLPSSSTLLAGMPGRPTTATRSVSETPNPVVRTHAHVARGARPAAECNQSHTTASAVVVNSSKHRHHLYRHQALHGLTKACKP